MKEVRGATLLASKMKEGATSQGVQVTYKSWKKHGKIVAYSILKDHSPAYLF